MRVEGSEYAERCDVVVKAIVEKPDYSFLTEGFVDEKGRLKLDEAADGAVHAAGHSLGEGVFAGGDFVTGPATVAKAICAGRDAALSIDRYLKGGAEAGAGGAGGAEAEKEPVCTFSEAFSGSCLEPSDRVEVPELALSERLRGLDVEETSTLDLTAVEGEASRCFNCGCVAVNSSDLAPVLIVLSATVTTSRRVIPAEDFFSVGVDTSTVLDDGELVLKVEIPRPGSRAPGRRSSSSH